MEFNKKIASNILEQLKKISANEISIIELEDSIEMNLEALDSTFPLELKSKLDNLVSTIFNEQNNTAAKFLNTATEANELDAQDTVAFVECKKMLEDFVKA